MDQQAARPVVYLTSGIFGYLYRFFPIGRTLIERGHRVVIITASDQAANHATAAGFEVRHLSAQEGALSSLEEPRWGRVSRPVARRLPGASLGPRSAARRHWAAKAAVMRDSTELEAMLTELQPELVLTEAEEHRDIRIALASQCRVVLFEDLYSVRPGPDVPFPGSSHQVPSGTLLSRFRAAVGWGRFLWSTSARKRAERWWVDGNDWHSVLGELGNRAGLDDSAVNHRYFQFYDYPELPRIRTVAMELAFPGEPQPESVVGPIVDLDREVHDVGAAFAQHWEAVVGRRAAGGARVVYVSLGTFLAGMEQLTERIIEAASELPETELIVSVGRDAELWTSRQLPANVGVFERVPQLEVLANTDLVISTGGLNTGHEALWFGVPILNLPIAGLDTPGNAARLVHHGVGRQLTSKSPGVDELRAELRELLDNPAYRTRAAEIGDRMRSYGAIAAAADVIEQHLGS